MAECFISFDIETLGGDPSRNYMFNLGAVAYTSDRKLLGEISLNFASPEGAAADAATLQWFQTQHADAYARMTKDALEPALAMAKLREWCTAMCAGGLRPVFIAYPTIFDGTWLSVYWFRYLGHPSNGRGPGFSVIDIRSYAMGRLGLATYAESGKEKALKPYMPDPASFPHTHTGLDDAHEQAMLFFNVRDGVKSK